MIRIVQHLCINRHCITAVAYDAPDGHIDPEVVKGLAELEKEGQVDPWCGICGSRELFFEDAVTKFQTMAAAKQALAEAEVAQIWTRHLIDQSKRKAGEN